MKITLLEPSRPDPRSRWRSALWFCCSIVGLVVAMVGVGEFTAVPDPSTVDVAASNLVAVGDAGQPATRMALSSAPAATGSLLPARSAEAVEAEVAITDARLGANVSITVTLATRIDAAPVALPAPIDARLESRLVAAEPALDRFLQTEPTPADGPVIAAAEVNAGSVASRRMSVTASSDEGPSEPAARADQSDVRVVIPSIGVDRDVIRGAQDEIDAGHVVAFTPSQWDRTRDLSPAERAPDSCWPGDGCTVWLAAHRSSSGSSFLRLPELQPGDAVHLDRDGRRYTYVVDQTSVDDNMISMSYFEADLLIQTSLPDDRRLLVSATEVG